jgi:predicted PilT family ATPase
VALLGVIIGTRGQTLQAIQNRTATSIQVPSRDALHEDDQTCSITVTGDAAGCKDAQAEIEKIVADRSSRTTEKMEGIDPSWYPFISGQRGERIDALAKEMDVRVFVPSAAHVEEGDQAITVTGNRDSVMAAMQRIHDMYRDMQRTYRTLAINIPKQQHKFLIGPKGAYVTQVYQATGCHVELAKADDPNEVITIRGPEAQLIAALDMVMDKANAHKIALVDVAAVHASKEHAFHIVRYLLSRVVAHNVEVEYGVTLARHGTYGIEIVGKNSEHVDKAKNAVQIKVFTLVEQHVRVVDIPAEMIGHVLGKKQQNVERIRHEHGVVMVAPEDRWSDASSDFLLVFEGSDKHAAQSALLLALDEVNRIKKDAVDYASVKLNVPSKHHRFILGHKGSTLREIIGEEASVAVWLGSSQKPHEGLGMDDVLVKGSQEDVARVVKEIQRVVEEGKHNEVMNSYVVDFTVPKKFLAQLIGKGGANIGKLSSRLDVKINVDSGASEEEAVQASIRIQGKKKHVDEAKAYILDMMENLADQTTITLSVARDLHSAIIGPSGRFVHKLENNYGVKISFPKGDDASDDIVIRGGKKGVHATKQEIVDLVEYETARKHTTTVQIPAKYVRHVLGRGGSRINAIRDETDTRIDVERKEEGSEEEDGTLAIVITGTVEGVKKAKEGIISIVKEQESNVTLTVSIEPKFHKLLIGQGGGKLKQLLEQHQNDVGEPLCTVNFPKRHDGQSSDDKVTIKGDKKACLAVRAELEQLVDLFAKRVTLSLTIPMSERSTIIGRGGQTLKEISSTFNVDVDMPKASDATHGTITVTGLQENCEAAIQQLSNLVREQEQVTVSSDDHALLMRVKGDVFRQLKSSFNVTADIAPAVNEQARIDQENEEAFVWTLRGQGAQLPNAKQWITDKIAHLKRFGFMERLTIDKDYHRFIIGKGGNRLTQIKKATDCKIDLPKLRAGKPVGEVIVITGTEKGVQRAKEMIMEIVEAQNKGQGEEIEEVVEETVSLH